MKINLTKAKIKVITAIEKLTNSSSKRYFVKKASGEDSCQISKEFHDDDRSLFLINLGELEEMFQISFDDWPDVTLMRFYVEGCGWVKGVLGFGSLMFTIVNSSPFWRTFATNKTRRLHVSMLIIEPNKK